MPSSVPKLGETRCYWMLLNANLQFLFLDPVLSIHMKEQTEADSLIGHSLLEFIHPHERENASYDLHNVIQNKALHGTVTRVKYMRASQLRVKLGSGTTRETFPHQEQVGYDDQYLPCDIVINWVADNVVLCFVHAIIDISPGRDNDPLRKSHWTNWCGTITLDREAATLCYARLFKADVIAPPPKGSNRNYNPHRLLDYTAPERIFQILSNSPTRPILFSWPTENYYPRDFGRLAANVEIDTSAAPNADPSSIPPDSEMGKMPQDAAEATAGVYEEAKTSCTRRYKSLQSFTANDIVREVESIFIPHGAVIFACHLVLSSRHVNDPPPASSSSSKPRFGYNGPVLHPSPTFYQSESSNGSVHSFSSPMSGPAGLDNGYPFEHATSAHQPLPSHLRHTMPREDWGEYDQHHSIGAVFSSPAGPSTAGYTRRRSDSPPHAYTSYHQHPTTQPHENVYVPTSSEMTRVITSAPGTSTGYVLHGPYNEKRAYMNARPPKVRASEGRPPGPRGGGVPPKGVTECAHCGTKSSPEWRKGETGIKDLCNACGLRYARTKQKEEGYVPTRRRPGGAGVGASADDEGGGPPAGKIAKRSAGSTPRGNVGRDRDRDRLDDPPGSSGSGTDGQRDSEPIDSPSGMPFAE